MAPYEAPFQIKENPDGVKTTTDNNKSQYIIRQGSKKTTATGNQYPAHQQVNNYGNNFEAARKKYFEEDAQYG